MALGNHTDGATLVGEEHVSVAALERFDQRVQIGVELDPGQVIIHQLR